MPEAHICPDCGKDAHVFGDGGKMVCLDGHFSESPRPPEWWVRQFYGLPPRDVSGSETNRDTQTETTQDNPAT